MSILLGIINFIPALLYFNLWKIGRAQFYVNEDDWEIQLHKTLPYNLLSFSVQISLKNALISICKWATCEKWIFKKTIFPFWFRLTNLKENPQRCNFLLKQKDKILL